jgi:hypothetical protein
MSVDLNLFYPWCTDERLAFITNINCDHWLSPLITAGGIFEPCPWVNLSCPEAGFHCQIELSGDHIRMRGWCENAPLFELFAYSDHALDFIRRKIMPTLKRSPA